MPEPPEKNSQLFRAIKGLAYTSRKLGRYRDADAAYQELIALFPTADLHFLLARFYEDTQQATKAHFHARQAIQLDPTRYQIEGQKLIDLLTTKHFGCWSVFVREIDRQLKPGLSS